MQRLRRFARYWDLVANSGRFANTFGHMLGAAPFDKFMAFSDWIYTKTDATHRIALERLAGAGRPSGCRSAGMERTARAGDGGQRLCGRASMRRRKQPGQSGRARAPGAPSGGLSTHRNAGSGSRTNSFTLAQCRLKMRQH